MSLERLKKIADVATTKALRSYRWAEHDDVEQEVLSRIFGAPHRADDWERYARVAAARVAKAQAWRTRPLWGALFDITALPDPRPGADKMLWRARVAWRADRVLAGVRGGTMLARPVLWDGEKPREVARRERVEVGEIYNALSRARRALREDRELLGLWKEGL